MQLFFLLWSCGSWDADNSSFDYVAWERTQKDNRVGHSFSCGCLPKWKTVQHLFNVTSLFCFTWHQRSTKLCDSSYTQFSDWNCGTNVQYIMRISGWAIVLAVATRQDRRQWICLYDKLMWITSGNIEYLEKGVLLWYVENSSRHNRWVTWSTDSTRGDLAEKGWVGIRGQANAVSTLMLLFDVNECAHFGCFKLC